jgi:AcrR family transcriptional regulator
MRAKIETEVRREPIQERSKVTVGAILEAAARLLPKVGADRLTTRQIADLAGVGIGSLYGYFPNKDSLLNAIVRQILNSRTEQFRKAMEEARREGSLEKHTHHMVCFMVDNLLSERARDRELIKKMMYGIHKQRSKVIQYFVHLLAGDLEHFQPGLPFEEYLRAAFLAVHSVLGVVDAILTCDPAPDFKVEDLTPLLETMLMSIFKSTLNKAAAAASRLRVAA